ncbi:MAG: nucleotidyl transferase AbiEii/AbiGii toxin family protein, partial [Bacteroidota bacterium]|nr:nucleotidyl transferase AbiEii/AbiGii toxin family protein [Bacteroidota bacterium]
MLFYNTVTPLLRQVLQQLMVEDLFLPFRLVGGTSLSLQLGHRESVDIDLFTDAEYGSIDFKAIDAFLRANYSYVDTLGGEDVGMGRSYYIGKDPKHCIKLDLFYSTEPFMRPVLLLDDIRFAQIEEIIAMKIEVIANCGRKKDFWD